MRESYRDRNRRLNLSFLAVRTSMMVSKLEFHTHATILWAVLAVATWPPQASYRNYGLTLLSGVICVFHLVQFLRWSWISFDSVFSQKTR